MDWMQEALCANQLYPVNLNLTLLTDDTALFAFGGVKNSEGELEWKIIDETNVNVNVRSDFKVGKDAENNGGLRVRLTFTFTASGLAAPLYIAVSGLTGDELCPKLCPDDILATEVPGLCKGGDGIFNNDIGWLVFLCADPKERTDGGDNGSLGTANKQKIFITMMMFSFPSFVRSARNLGGSLARMCPSLSRLCRGLMVTLVNYKRCCTRHARR